MRRRLARWAALALAAAACGQGQEWRRTPPELPEQLRIAFPSLECLRIGDGPQLCVVELSRSPIVALGLSVSAGAQFDPYQLPGAAQAALTAVFKASDEQGVPVLETALGELGGPLQVSVGSDGALLSTYVVPQRLHDAARLLLDTVIAPTLDARALASVRSHQCRRAQEILGDPAMLASLAVRRTSLPPRHPAMLPALRIQFCNEALGAAEAATLARQLLVPAHTTVLLAGPVTIDEVAPWFRQLTASWTPTSGGLARRFEVVPRDGAATIVDLRGLAQTVIAIGGLTAPGRPVDDPALALAVAYARSEVQAELRQDLAVTYGVSATIEPVGDRSLWMLTTQVDAAASVAALRVLRSSLSALSQRAIAEDEVFTVGIQTLVTSMRTYAVAVDAVRELASRHRAGAPLAEATERARDPGAIEAADVERLLRTTFAPERAQLVVVGEALSLSEAVVLRDARVIRPITVLDGL